MLDGSLSYKHATLSGSEKAMDCVTVFCGSRQDLKNRSYWLLGTGLSLGALRGLVWTVYHFSTRLTKIHGLHLKFVRNS
jgi:hypothetical protein